MLENGVRLLKSWVTRWWFQTFLEFSPPKLGEDITILTNIFQMGGWENNHQPGQNDEETDENPQIKVAWPESDHLTSVHSLEDVRTLGSEVLCYSRDPFKRVSWREKLMRRFLKKNLKKLW